MINKAYLFDGNFLPQDQLLTASKEHPNNKDKSFNVFVLLKTKKSIQSIKNLCISQSSENCLKRINVISKFLKKIHLLHLW